jgi:2-oxoisovalerate dehydrogenase E1 component alpha subunit
MTGAPPKGHNAPGLQVPEPPFRPGDPVDYAFLSIPPAGAQARPAVGPWNPMLSPDVLRHMLRNMTLLRAFDDRMFRGQRQGKTSFYMKCTGEEATSVAALWRSPRTTWFPQLPPAGHPDRARLSDRRDDQPDLFEPGGQAEGPAAADHVFKPRICFLHLQRQSATQYPQAVGWAMASAIKGDTRIAASWIGEGSSAEGDFHAAMTFATVYNAPVMFNVVNNQWAISSFSGFAGAERTTFAARAIGYGMAGLRVDGNDALAVYAACAGPADRARAGARARR